MQMPQAPVTGLLPNKADPQPVVDPHRLFETSDTHGSQALHVVCGVLRIPWLNRHANIPIDGGQPFAVMIVGEGVMWDRSHPLI